MESIEETKPNLIDFCGLVSTAENHAKRVNSPNHARSERAEERGNANLEVLKAFWSELPEELKKLPLEELPVHIGEFEGMVKDWLEIK